MVIGHIFAVADFIGNSLARHICPTYSSRAYGDSFHSLAHIIRQISAVGAGIGTELLFVKALHIVKCLLCGVTVDAVCIALERCEIVKQRRS